MLGCIKSKKVGDDVNVRILDITLREGIRKINYFPHPDSMSSIVATLNEAEIWGVDFGYPLGIGSQSATFPESLRTDREIAKAIVPNLGKLTWQALFDLKEGTLHQWEGVLGQGITEGRIPLRLENENKDLAALRYTLRRDPKISCWAEVELNVFREDDKAVERWRDLGLVGFILVEPEGESSALQVQEIIQETKVIFPELKMGYKGRSLETSWVAANAGADLLLSSLGSAGGFSPTEKLAEKLQQAGFGKWDIELLDDLTEFMVRPLLAR